MRNYINIALLVCVFSLTTTVLRAEDQRDPNWSWKDSASNPNNAPYKLKNSSKLFANSPVNPKNAPGSASRVGVIEKMLLTLVTREVGYAVERDQVSNGVGSYINIFNNDGDRVGYCPDVGFAQLKVISGVSTGDVEIKKDYPICFDVDGDSTGVIFRFNS